jgi:IS4 transposase
MEKIDCRPEQVFEVGLESRILERRNQGVTDVGDSAGDNLGVRQRPWVGLALKRTVAIELQLGQKMLRWG